MGSLKRVLLVPMAGLLKSSWELACRTESRGASEGEGTLLWAIERRSSATSSSRGAEGRMRGSLTPCRGGLSGRQGTGLCHLCRHDKGHPTSCVLSPAALPFPGLGHGPDLWAQVASECLPSWASPSLVFGAPGSHLETGFPHKRSSLGNLSGRGGTGVTEVRSRVSLDGWGERHCDHQS